MYLQMKDRETHYLVGAPIAQWVKRWPGDIVVPSSSQTEVDSS